MEENKQNDPAPTPVQTPQATIPAQESPKPSTGIVQKSNYFGRLFQGRINRRNYWVGSLLLGIFPLCLLLIVGIINFISPAPMTSLPPLDGTAQAMPIAQSQNPVASMIEMLAVILMVLYDLILIPFAVSLYIRRLHDLDKSGWVMLLAFVPVINSLLGIYTAFFPGTEGENKFGPKPLPKVRIKEDIFKIQTQTT